MTYFTLYVRKMFWYTILYTYHAAMNFFEAIMKIWKLLIKAKIWGFLHAYFIVLWRLSEYVSDLARDKQVPRAASQLTTNFD